MKKLEVTTITQKVVIPKATPKQVYEAYVDPKKHSEFTTSKATGKPLVGGKFTAWDGYISGKFLELEEGKRVVQEWTSTDFPEGYPPSKLELTFCEVPKGTEIIMVHSHVPKTNEPYWGPKLKRNLERDKVTTEQLESEGWLVVRFWEHELSDINVALAEMQVLLNRTKNST